jgi:hypothetical protein
MRREVLRMPSIALLASGAKLKRQESGAGVNSTLVGDVHLLDCTTKPAYVKLLEGRRLANELLALELASRLALAVPEAFVVRLRRTDHEALFRQLGLNFDDVYGFGTAALAANSLAREFNVNDPGFIKWFFGTLKEWKDVVAFDAWVANEDRHTNNLLVDKQLKLWLIDHDLALGGRRDVSTLRPEEVTRNRLVNDFGPFVDTRHRHEVVDECHRFQAAANAIDVPAAAHASEAGLFVTDEELNQLILYVERRRAFVPTILADSLGVSLLA